MAKFAVLLYAADYMVRRMAVKERFFRAVLPMAFAVLIVGVLLLAEPDILSGDYDIHWLEKWAARQKGDA